MALELDLAAISASPDTIFRAKTKYKARVVTIMGSQMVEVYDVDQPAMSVFCGSLAQFEAMFE